MVLASRPSTVLSLNELPMSTMAVGHGTVAGHVVLSCCCFVPSLPVGSFPRPSATSLDPSAPPLSAVATTSKILGL